MTDFKDAMSKRSDAELIEITTKLKNDYQPEAVSAAIEELKSRDLKPEEIESAESEIQEKEEINKELAEIPLATVWKVLTFIKPGVIQLFIAIRMRGDGKERMADELKKYTLYGFGFYLSLVVLILILQNL